MVAVSALSTSTGPSRNPLYFVRYMIRSVRGRWDCADPTPVALTLEVNGVPHRLEVGPDETLLQVLRLRLGLTGAKPACERGECGACSVLVGGVPRLSCITLVATVAQPVLTAEGLASTNRELRERFAERGGFQCGYCTPGQIVSATAIVDAGVPADEPAVRHQMSGNICRCTGYAGIVAAIRDALGAPDMTPGEGDRR